jgi:hypothetical protein
MLYGLSVGEVTILASLLVGGILSIGGLVFLFREFLIGVYPAEIELPKLLGKTKLKVPSGLAAITIGGALLGYPLWKAYDVPPSLSVLGKMQLLKGKTVSGLSGVLVAVLPNSHIVPTAADGSYSVDIPRGAKAYQGIAYLPDKKLFHLGVVAFSPEGQGRFDHIFDEGEKK